MKRIWKQFLLYISDAIIAEGFQIGINHRTDDEIKAFRYYLSYVREGAKER